MTRRTTIDLSAFNSSTLVSKVNDYIGKFSQPSFHRWTHQVVLYLPGIKITRPLLDSMVQFLNLPLAKDPSGTTNEERRWISVKLKGSYFAQQPPHLNPNMHNEDYCTPDDIQRLFLAFTHRTLSLRIDCCYKMLTDFLSIHHHHHHHGPFQGDTFEFFNERNLSFAQYANLGDMIQPNDHLKTLRLKVPFLDGADELFARLANLSVNLQKLSLTDLRREEPQEQDLVPADQLVGNNRDGPVIRLLQNPRNQIKALSLRGVGLKDHHLIAILQVIPTSQMEELYFDCNFIHVQGMLELANLLPAMSSLKILDFGCNPWCRSSSDCCQVIAALSQGMRENTSIDGMYGIEIAPQAPLLLHYLALNRAGRRILTSSKPVVDGLWPLLLERAGKMPFHAETEYLTEVERTYIYNGEANGVYYFLRNCPRILAFRSWGEAK